MADRPLLESALELDALGYNVLPASVSSKQPTVDWKPYQTQRSSAKLRAWFQGSKRFHLCIVTGAVSGVIVLDVDSQPALEYWTDRLGAEVLGATAYCRSPKASKLGEGLGHYHFKLPTIDGGTPTVRSRSTHDQDTGMHWDLKADRAITIVPPSAGYEWVRHPTEVELVVAPEALMKPPREQDGGGDGVQPRSTLMALLKRPGWMGRKQIGRNDWVTRVLGHYAKMHRDKQDLWEYEVERVFEMALEIEGDHEYTWAECAKTRDSIWGSEHEKNEEAVKCSEECGWLIGNGPQIDVQVRSKDVDGETRIDFEAWSDFNIRALGVVEDADAQRTYDVEVLRRRKNDVVRALLPASALSDARKLAGWLAELGVGVMPPDNVWPRAGSTPERLRRYIEQQDPPRFEVVDSLGWHTDGFLAHEGVIRGDGLHDFEQHKPEPRLRNWAPYRYGFAPEDRAIEVLREVMSFHDPMVTAVFGAWWVACMLKPQIHEITSQFPFMALEAPSESGKTTGFFSMMLQLGGNTQGQVDPTRASLRDFISAHQSGIVWIDDLSDTGYLMDLLRQATGEGSVSKKGEDRTKQEVVKLVAPICISGEALQLHDQKALVDRAVMLSVPSPTSRRSVKDPKRLQWVDVVALRKEHPDLTNYAGSLVSAVLRRAAMIDQLPELVPEAGGRWGDKIAVVRTGARILADLIDDPDVVGRVESWAADQDDQGSENSLTLKLLPTALRVLDWPSRVQPSGITHPGPTPEVVFEDRVWFHPESLAEWWAKYSPRVEVRTESSEALKQQAAALGLGTPETKRRFNVGPAGKHKLHLWGLDPELSRLVIGRSRGASLAGARRQMRLQLEADEAAGGRVHDAVQSAVHGPPSGVHPQLKRLEAERSLMVEQEPEEGG